MLYDLNLFRNLCFAEIGGPINSALGPQKNAKRNWNIVSVWILFIVENWKCYSKIIFKYVNSIVRPSFKVRFIFFHTCESHKQCIGPNQKTQMSTQT